MKQRTRYAPGFGDRAASGAGRDLPPHAGALFATVPWLLCSCTGLLADARADDVEALPASAEFAPAHARAVDRTAALDDDDSVVRIVTGTTACSGTMIHEQLVLTAHHCVVERDQYGGFLSRDVDPDRIRVELGGDYLPWGEVGVSAIVAPPCGHASGLGDIAILVLDRAIATIPVKSADFVHAPEPEQAVAPVGFGRCSASAEDGIKRRNRRGGSIKVMKDTRFQLDAAICPGDSGGPAVDSHTGQVVGVISASVMDGRDATRGRTEFTRLDRWRSVFATAELVLEGTPLAELPPPSGCPHE